MPLTSTGNTDEVVVILDAGFTYLDRITTLRASSSNLWLLGDRN